MEATEKKVSHTPGPWTLGFSRDGKVALIDAGHIAEVNIDTNPNGEANAKLIAAAPELLDALIGMLPENQDPVFNGEPSLAAVERAIEAIKKATE